MSAEFEDRQATAGGDSPPEVNEPISTSSDLEQAKKRAAEAFYAQGNVGTTQIFVNQLGSMNLGPQLKPDASAKPPADQTYALDNRKDCTAFVERYQNSEHLAVAIVLSIFELVYLGDLPDLKEQLMEELPEAVPAGEDAAPLARNPYISVDTFLSVIGGEWFTSEEGRQYVGLGTRTQKALQNLWEQFPALRDPICRWMVRLCQNYKARTDFDAYQMVCAFARVVSIDFEDAQKRIFARLYSIQRNTGLLGNLVCKLYGEAGLEKKLEQLLQSWLSSGSNWLWQPACLACSFLMPKLDEQRLAPALEKTIRFRLVHMSRDDSTFLAILLLQSEYFRTLLARLLCQMVQRANGRAERLATAQTYLYLLRSGYYLVDRRQPELPLAACDTSEQQRFLTPVLAVVLGQTSLRRQQNVILRAYLEELDHYRCSDRLFDHLCAYFYNMGSAAPDYRSDILGLLSNCRGSLAQHLRERLLPLYTSAQRLPSPV